jgi:hypothetical protein
MIHGVWLAVLGILGASNLIIARRPDAADLIGKLAPYQGWIGAVSALWGVWGVISCILHLNWMTVAPVYWFSWLADSVLQAGLGLLLGVGVLKSFIKDAAANTKMDQTITRLGPYQGTMGLIAIGLGVWMVAASMMFGVT